MASKQAFLDGQWVPNDSRITYQNFQHWEEAMIHSNQAEGQHLRQEPTWDQVSPKLTLQANDKQQSGDVHEIHSDVIVHEEINPDVILHEIDYDVDVLETQSDTIVFRLARNPGALEALRRTHKMRYRHNLKYLAASFPLADELATMKTQAKKESEQAKKELEQIKKKAEQAKRELEQAKKESEQVKKASEQAKKASEKTQGLTSAEILAQKELAKRKKEITLEQLKELREMKDAKTKAAAEQRLKDKAAKSDPTGKQAQKAAGKSMEKTARKGADKTARKTAEKTAGKSAEKAALESTENPWKIRKGTEVVNIFSLETTKRKRTEETTAQSAKKARPEKEAPEKEAPKKAVTEKAVREKAVPKSTASKPGKMSLRAKMMPKMKRW